MQRIKAKKSLGQNFLNNKNTLDKIIKSSQIQTNDFVVEVGPGKGILTEELLKKAKEVLSIEKDHELIPFLKEKFKNKKNLKLIEADILESEPPQRTYKLVANIPYYISSPILNHFLQAKNKPQSMTLLVQKEVAEKVCSKTGQHSILSLQVQLFGHPLLISKVPASHFSPAPKIESAILYIDVYKSPKYENPLQILKFAKMAFSQKRKKLRNTLIKSLKLDAAKIEKESKIDLNRRPETLSLEEWESLTKAIKKALKTTDTLIYAEDFLKGNTNRSRFSKAS